MKVHAFMTDRAIGQRIVTLSVVAIATGFMSTGCTSPKQPQGQSSQTQQQGQTGVGACSGADGEILAVRSYALEDRTVQGYVFVNRSAETCKVSGYPLLSMLDNHMRVISLHVIDGTLTTNAADATARS